MLTIINILNPLTGGSSTTEYVWESGKSLADYMEYEGECAVAYNNAVIHLPLDKIFPADRDEYTVMPIPEGGDRQSWRVLAMTGLTAASYLIPMAAPLRVMMFTVGGYIINNVLADRPENIDESASYGWQHQSSPSAAHGSPMLVIYGRTRVRPTLKNRYVVIDGDKQYLYALYSIAAHKVDERGLPEYALGAGNSEVKYNLEPGMSFENSRWAIERAPGTPKQFPLYESDGKFGKGWSIGHGTAAFYGDVIINGAAIQGYNADVDWETRPGLPQQIVIVGFETTYNNMAMDVGLYFENPIVGVSTSSEYVAGT